MTLLTMKQEAASDGFDTYGFPFTFYDNFEGKCDNCYDNFGFKPILFFADILIILVFAYLIVFVKNKFFKEK